MYGLHVQATQSIPGLSGQASGSPVDLWIFLGGLPDWWREEAAHETSPSYASVELAQPGLHTLRVWALFGGRYHRLLYADGTEFFVDGAGTRVWCRWPDSLTLEDAATYLLGPVMGFVLLLRGVICLHASAVAVDGKAVAIAGPAEAGKSTAAAALAGLGYPVLSDDVVTLDDRAGALLVQPGYPFIRLWPGSVEALYGSADALPRLTPNWDKRYLDLIQIGHRFQEDSLPLGAIYVLDERSPDLLAPSIHALGGRAAIMSLLANTYSSRLMNPGMRARQLDLMARVPALVPVKRVVPVDDIASTTKLCRAIVEDFLAYAASPPTSASD
jgi:hypothetical protein